MILKLRWMIWVKTYKFVLNILPGWEKELLEANVRHMSVLVWIAQSYFTGLISVYSKLKWFWLMLLKLLVWRGFFSETQLSLGKIKCNHTWCHVLRNIKRIGSTGKFGCVVIDVLDCDVEPHIRRLLSIICTHKEWVFGAAFPIQFFGGDQITRFGVDPETVICPTNDGVGHQSIWTLWKIQGWVRGFANGKSHYAMFSCCMIVHGDCFILDKNYINIWQPPCNT